MLHKNYTGIQDGGIFAFEYNQIQPLYFTEKLIQKLKGVAFHPIRKGGKKEYPSRLVNTKHVLRQRAFKTSLKNPIFRFDQASKKQISLFHNTA